MTRIFLSYRRTDTAELASDLHRRLAATLPEAELFLDTAALIAGQDWWEQLDRAVRSADWVIVVIGRGWRVVGASGHRRLDDRDDVVRAEVSMAVRHGVPILPVLADGAPMPAATELPRELARVTRLHALPYSIGSGDADVARIADVVAHRDPAAGRPPVPAPVLGNWVRATAISGVSYEFDAYGTYLRMGQLRQARPAGDYLFETWEEGLADVDERDGSMVLAPFRAGASQTDPADPSNCYRDERRETAGRTLSWRLIGPAGRLLELSGPDEDPRLPYERQ